jgi:hypothetical protein
MRSFNHSLPASFINKLLLLPLLPPFVALIFLLKLLGCLFLGNHQ